MSFSGLDPIRFGSVSMVTATLGANDPEVGTIVREGDEEYIFVYNAGNSQISPGHGAVVSAVTGYSVSVSSVTQVDLPIGVCKHATLTTATYGWLLIRGFGQVQMAASDSAAAGQGLCLGVDGTWALKSNATDYRTPMVAKAMAAIASNVSGTAFFKIF